MPPPLHPHPHLPPGSDPDPSDPELLALVRSGDLEAYGVLHRRHAAAAGRLAQRLSRNGHDADDLVAEAFARVLAVLRQGRGPTDAFRPYLCSTVRRLAYDRTAREHREQPRETQAEVPSADGPDPVLAAFEQGAAAAAFASLPERWQAVLWHLEVEGAKPREVAPLVGLSPNAVSALAVRAREGLRQAYLAQHATAPPQALPACAATRVRLGGYLRGGLGPTAQRQVSAHLERCPACQDAYLELLDDAAVLRALAVLAVAGPAGLTAFGPEHSSLPAAGLRRARRRPRRSPRTGRAVALVAVAAAMCATSLAVAGVRSQRVGAPAGRAEVASGAVAATGAAPRPAVRGAATAPPDRGGAAPGAARLRPEPSGPQPVPSPGPPARTPGPTPARALHGTAMRRSLAPPTPTPTPPRTGPRSLRAHRVAAFGAPVHPAPADPGGPPDPEGQADPDHGPDPHPDPRDGGGGSEPGPVGGDPPGPGCLVAWCGCPELDLPWAPLGWCLPAGPS